MAQRELFHRGELKSFFRQLVIRLVVKLNAMMRLPRAPEAKEAMEAVLLIQALIIFVLLEKFVL
jgi:hypothetical protein